MRQTILIYSPDVVGHPRVYCRVIADALADAPVKIVVAMGFTDEAGLQHSPDLWPLENRQGLTLLDTRTVSSTRSPHLTAEEIGQLQWRVGADVTLFIEADKSSDQFLRIADGAAPSLHGRNLAIFAKTAEWYPGEDSFTGEKIKFFGPTLRRTLGNAKRAVLNGHETYRHFYENRIIRSGIFSEIIVKDERLAQWRGPPVSWMPEISRPPAAAETAVDAEEYAQRSADLEDFLACNRGREPVLYFGDAAYYKGYDLFIRFLAEHDDICGLHPGVSDYSDLDRQRFSCDVEALRVRLLREGRLLETNAYVHSQKIKELFFRAVRVYLTTHRLALSSSTMIQAAEFGLPVLVPDRGLIAHRVKKHGIGDVYAYGDLADLRQKAQSLWRRDLSGFRQPVGDFWRMFSDEAIRAFFRARLAPAPAEPTALAR